jgi:hypothetical protein
MVSLNYLKNKQINILKVQKKKINYYNKKKINTHISNFCYPCTWYENFGYYNLKYNFSSKNIKNLAKYFIFFIKDVFLISIIPSYKLYVKKKNKKKSKKLLITWGGSENFDYKGNYKDRKFRNIKSFNNLVIASDSLTGSKYKSQELVIYRDNEKKFSLFFLIKNICLFIIRNNFSIIKLFHYFHVYYFYSLWFENRIMQYLKHNKINYIKINYEGQPFQNYFISSLKKNYPNIFIEAHIFNSQPLPMHLLFNKQKIDRLIVYQKQIKYQLINRLGWDKKIIQYQKIKNKLKRNFSNKIFIGYGVNDPKKMLLDFEKLIKKEKFYFEKKDIMPHPVMKDTLKHKILLNGINDIMYDLKKSKKRIVVVFGSTAIIPEILEQEKEVIQINNDLVIESYSSYFWPKIKEKVIYKNIIKYTKKY